ncbi:hypothetical protein SAMN06265222_12035 [Neorhodopirellula lusitana]|uniref:Uncharacterized protein n=1 Tax=Neorhodopirellula lusitana TaxID=445327 RepID=A0ABY1QNP5_9BACT|nr:hypothetical protein SAMN06265222_12035 [Neorhodopirellula lusitana]
MFYWLNIVVPVVELCLFLVAGFFWLQNQTFRVSVDADRFEITNPISKSASFSVPTREIVEIKKNQHKHSNTSTIMMYMKGGERIQISQNHHFSRGKLYAALAKANPSISLPKSAYRFKQV